MFGSISFFIAEVIGVITIGILADQYGRKLMLLMCLYIPVVCLKLILSSNFFVSSSLAFRIVSCLYDDLSCISHPPLARRIFK